MLIQAERHGRPSVGSESVGPLTIRRHLQRHRRRIAMVAAVVVCASAVAAHHGAMAMGDAHHDMGASAAVEMCLAVVTAIGTAVIATMLGVIALGRWRPPLDLTPTVGRATSSPTSRSRAGPSVLRLLCVSRR